jgi:hypothetical protein
MPFWWEAIAQIVDDTAREEQRSDVSVSGHRAIARGSAWPASKAAERPEDEGWGATSAHAPTRTRGRGSAAAEYSARAKGAPATTRTRRPRLRHATRRRTLRSLPHLTKNLAGVGTAERALDCRRVEQRQTKFASPEFAKKKTLEFALRGKRARRDLS